VKPRSVSRPRDLSVNGGLAKAHLSLVRCGSGMLRETIGSLLSLISHLLPFGSYEFFFNDVLTQR
jgi:hypothetical protein